VRLHKDFTTASLEHPDGALLTTPDTNP